MKFSYKILAQLNLLLLALGCTMAIAQPTINLKQSVFMKGEAWDYQRYTSTMVNEQKGARDYLDSDSIQWNVPASLSKKVNSNGELLPFFGDTTVFTLTSSQVQQLDPILNYFESTLPFLASPLDRQQLHMTLHDLSNDPILANVQQSMAHNQERVREIFIQLKKYLTLHPEERYLTMRVNGIYPCLNISLLLGLEPASDKDFKKLINLYNLFDEVVYLNYWLRPHITLSYFLPKQLNKSEISLLSHSLKKIGTPKLEFTFDLLELSYQHFFDMNDYRDVIKP